MIKYNILLVWEGYWIPSEIKRNTHLHRKNLKLESLRQKDNLKAGKKKNMINFSGIDIKVTTEFSNRNYGGQSTVE